MPDTRLAGPVIEAIAGQNLSGHRVVTNEAICADQSTPSHLGCVRGITTGAAIGGDTVRIQVYGPMTDPSFDWQPGPIYVGTNGVLTQTPPTTGWLQQVATADSPTLIFIDIQPPIALGN